MYTSPGRMVPALRAATIAIDSPIDPRCTGMCGALAMSPPCASNTAQEKSSRSLMLTECAVARSRAPICSATDMNRLLKISSSTGSTSVPASLRPGRGATRVSSRSPRGVTSARQPGSTTVVAKSSAISAGPSTPAPGRRSRRRASGTPAHLRSTYIETAGPRLPTSPGGSGCPRETSPPAVLSAGFRAIGGRGASRGTLCPPGSTASTDTASTRIVLSGIRNENCCR